jgi:HAD superfamily hydrolase (TIGR01509 family)
MVLAGVLFDMDGTLIDSEKIWEVGLQELAASLGGRLSDAARASMMGTSTAESMRILHDDLGLVGRDEMESGDWLDTRVMELFADGLEWRPGARELVAAVRAAGVPTALVTATRRVLVDAALVTLGRHNFDAVVCGDEVERAKPDPMPYLIAAATLDVDPRTCVAIEDSSTGVSSALAAGCTVLAVPHEVPLGPPDGVHVVSSLLDVDLPLLRSLVRDRV